MTPNCDHVGAFINSKRLALFVLIESAALPGIRKLAALIALVAKFVEIETGSNVVENPLGCRVNTHSPYPFVSYDAKLNVIVALLVSVTFV